MNTLPNTALDPTDEHIIRTLLYYDIFNYPLRSGEVFRFLGTNHVNEDTIDTKLKALAGKGLIFQFGDLYSIQNSEMNIERRIKGNREAEKYLPLAYKQARFIARFPYIRAVMASGSLSKGYMDEKSDLDFFIVTARGKLWIARMLLVLYKRMFLFNSHKYFCVNYFVDTDHLEIEEKNLFTATELATAIPLCGAEPYKNLHAANAWLTDFFPNYKPRPTDGVLPVKTGAMKKLAENFIGLFSGKWLDSVFMHLTLKRWKKIYEQKYSASDFEVAFKTQKHASKNHPKNFQQKVMNLYEEKLKWFSTQTK